MNDLCSLSDDALIESTKRAVARERSSIADVIEHIAEVQHRKLYLDAACMHLTQYSVEVLGYSDDEASIRVTAAYLSLDYPLVLEMLRAGELSLTTLRTLSPVLTPDNHDECLRAAAGKSKREVQELVANWKPDYRKEWASPLPKPIGNGRYKIELILDSEECELLLHARDVMRHSVPNGDLKQIMVRGARELLERTEARKFGRVKMPRRSDAAPEAIEARAPNQAMRREVSERDGYACCYVGTNGKRCSSKAWIEFDHREGFANTHRTDARTTRLLCKAHNLGRNEGHDDLR